MCRIFFVLVYLDFTWDLRLENRLGKIFYTFILSFFLFSFTYSLVTKRLEVGV